MCMHVYLRVFMYTYTHKLSLSLSLFLSLTHTNKHTHLKVVLYTLCQSPLRPESPSLFRQMPFRDLQLLLQLLRVVQLHFKTLGFLDQPSKLDPVYLQLVRCLFSIPALEPTWRGL